MGEQGLITCHPRPWRHTTDNDGSCGPPDLLEGDFTTEAPGQRFVGDITYIRTRAGWVYLATVIDLFNREVVGYAMATHMRTSLPIEALKMGIGRGLVKGGAVFHSDRGSQTLGSSVGVKDHTGCRPTVGDGHTQGVTDQRSSHVIRTPPPVER